MKFSEKYQAFIFGTDLYLKPFYDKISMSLDFKNKLWKNAINSIDCKILMKLIVIYNYLPKSIHCENKKNSICNIYNAIHCKIIIHILLNSQKKFIIYLSKVL